MYHRRRGKKARTFIQLAAAAVLVLFGAPSLFAQATANIQISVTVVPVVPPRQLTQPADSLVTAAVTRDAPTSRQVLGGLISVRTEVDRQPATTAERRRGRIVLEYSAN